MSIELHCPSCGKLIRAPDSAGGKHGKCPYCGVSAYIPMPPDESEEIGLAPVDQGSDHRVEELKRESAKYAAAIGHDSAMPPEIGGPDPEPSGGSVPPGGTGASIDIDGDIEGFVAAMRDSKLDEAEAAAARLSQAGREARKHVEQLMAKDTPLPIEGVPVPVVKGFLKTLLARLS